MRLLMVTGRPFSCTCAGCGRRVIAGNTYGEAIYADLDGLPFTSYFCGNCASDMRAAENTKMLTGAPSGRITESAT